MQSVEREGHQCSFHHGQRLRLPARLEWRIGAAWRRDRAAGDDPNRKTDAGATRRSWAVPSDADSPAHATERDHVQNVAVGSPCPHHLKVLIGRVGCVGGPTKDGGIDAAFGTVLRTPSGARTSADRGRALGESA
jgi:hypothetical protein